LRNKRRSFRNDGSQQTTSWQNLPPCVAPDTRCQTQQCRVAYAHRLPRSLAQAAERRFALPSPFQECVYHKLFCLAAPRQQATICLAAGRDVAASPDADARALGQRASSARGRRAHRACVLRRAGLRLPRRPHGRRRLRRRGRPDRARRHGRLAAQYGQADEGDPIAAIRTTPEAAGVEFTNARTPGARMRKPGQ